MMGTHRFGWRMGIGAAVLAVAMTFGFGYGAAFAGEVEFGIGKPMPDFELTDTKGKTHKLSDYKGKVVVIQFASHNCPWSRGADPQIAEMTAKYKEKGVVVLGINSNQGESPEQIQAYLDENNLKMTILKDDGNKYADKVKAAVTPDVYVVDQEGILVFRGAFDNRKAPAQAGEINYTAAAVDSALAKQEVAEAEVKAWGCTIKRAPRS